MFSVRDVENVRKELSDTVTIIENDHVGVSVALIVLRPVNMDRDTVSDGDEK